MKRNFKHNKIMIFVIIIYTLFTFLFHNYDADTYAQNIGCGIVNFDSEIIVDNTVVYDDTIITNYSDGAVLTEYDNGSYILNIPLTSSFFSDEDREYIINNGKQKGLLQWQEFFLKSLGEYLLLAQ